MNRGIIRSMGKLVAGMACVVAFSAAGCSKNCGPCQTKSSGPCAKPCGTTTAASPCPAGCAKPCCKKS